MSAILHISDLHLITEYSDGKTRHNKGYQEKFFNYLKDLKIDKKKVAIKYLIVTGDISNTGLNREFKIASSFLNELIAVLKIKKENIILCPGNHDICWGKVQTIIDEASDEDVKEPFSYHQEKFENFKKFYEEFFVEEKKIFIEDNAVVDVIKNEEEKLLIIGVNSCYKESYLKKDHIGFIDFDSFKSQIEDLKDECKSYKKLLVMHHNPEHFEKDEKSIVNWESILELLKDFPTIINGHIHSSEGYSVIKKTQKYFVSVSSYAKEDAEIKNAFNLLLPDVLDNTKYQVYYYEYETLQSKYWQLHDGKNAISEVSLLIERGESALAKIEKNPVDQFAKKKLYGRSKVDEIETAKFEVKTYSDLVDDLLDLISENKLFKSGHFHWSEKFRSHGVIDINYLISNQASMDLISELFFHRIINVLEEKNIKPDLIVGIGIAGNVIGARLSVMFPECDYSFVPDALKKEFTEFESKVKSGDYKKIIMLKDIIYIADTLKEIFERETFKEVDNLLIFSLFYCGKKNTETELFKEISNVNHFSICNKIVIERCPHEGDVNNCSIVENNLDTYYELYTKEE